MTSDMVPSWQEGDISSVVKFLRLNPKAFSFSDRPDIIDPEGGTLETEGRTRSALPNPQSGAKHKARQKKAGGTLVPAWSEAAVSSSGGAPPEGGHSLSRATCYICHPY